MRFSVVLPVLSAATLGLAQNTIIEVGAATDAPNGGIYQFIPPSISNIAVNTTITFRFTGAPGNHSVTQSSFDNPCNPIPGGFDSGWVFIPQNNVSTPPEWNLTITDASSPIWFYCKQTVPAIHCQSGMVGAINPPDSGDMTFSAYRSKAATFSSSGQEEGALVGVGASASAGPGPSVSGVTFYTGLPLATNSPTSSGGSSGSNNQNGALSTTASLLVVALGMVLGSYLCIA